MLAQLKVNNAVKKRSQRNDMGGSVLCSFRRPPPRSNGNYIKEIYARLPKKTNDNDICHHIQLGWYGRIHAQDIYYEPVDGILSNKIDALFYYLNDIHTRVSSFSRWWTTVCRPPTNTLTMNECIYVEEIQQYILVQDVLSPDKCWIYPGYEDCVIGSGRAVSIGSNPGTIVNDDIIYIPDKYTIVHFGSVAAATNHLLSVAAFKSHFMGHLLSGTIGKLSRGMKCRPVKYSHHWFGWRLVWLMWLQELLHRKGVECQETPLKIRISLSFDRVLDIFDLVEDDLRIEAVQCWLYNEEIVININKTTGSIKITSVVLKKNKKKNAIGGYDIIGLDLLKKNKLVYVFKIKN